jgi:hypothetical protein
MRLLSDAGHLTFRHNFVAGEVVALRVVAADTIGLHKSLKAFVMTSRNILHQVTHVSLAEVTVETSLEILDFLGSAGIVIVAGGLVDKLLVKGRLKEDVEVAHETGIVTELVLGEDGLETVVTLLTNLILLLGS